MAKKRTVICDIEADGLLPSVTQIWCIVCKDIDTGEVFKFYEDTLGDFHEFATHEVHHWVGHNFIGYDSRVLKKLMNIKIRPKDVTDTLILSRLQSQQRKGGHSLKNWGKFLEYGKGDYTDFTCFTMEMLSYCVTDVELTYKVYCYLKSEGVKYGSEEASKIEHLSQDILTQQSIDGFALDVPKAHQLYSMLKNKALVLEEQIMDIAPDLPKYVKEVTPKYKKGKFIKGGEGVYEQGTELSVVGLKFLEENWVNVVGPFSRIDYQVFNLDSPKQKVTRLNPYWEPIVRTKGYRKCADQLREGEITQEMFDERQVFLWTLNEENFNTIRDDAPQELKKLGEYAMLSARHKEISGWLDNLGEDDDRVHGNTNSIGAVTHRMSHDHPNLANIPGSKSPYGPECRSCYTVGDVSRYRLLGCDASGIQLRILAHYMNDDEYTNEVVNGDIHEKNLDAMGIAKGQYNEDHGQHEGRDTAKTFIYAWLLGAGDEKVGLIIGGTPADGRAVKESFLSNLPSLAALKKRAAKAARSGRLVGLDGRYLEIKSAHFALSVYLQGAESCIMKLAMVMWHRWAKAANLDYKQVAVVHDEFQVEVLHEHADALGKLIVKAIIKAGEYFKLNCPLDGEYKIGLNWNDTH